MKQFKYSFLFISTKKHKRSRSQRPGVNHLLKSECYFSLQYSLILIYWYCTESICPCQFQHLCQVPMPSPLEILSTADWSESGGVIIQWQQCSGWIQRNLHTRLIWSSVERKTGDDCAALCAPQPDDSGAGDASVTLPHCFYQSNLQCYCLGLSRLPGYCVLCPHSTHCCSYVSIST